LGGEGVVRCSWEQRERREGRFSRWCIAWYAMRCCCVDVPFRALALAQGPGSHLVSTRGRASLRVIRRAQWMLSTLTECADEFVEMSSTGYATKLLLRLRPRFPTHRAGCSSSSSSSSSLSLSPYGRGCPCLSVDCRLDLALIYMGPFLGSRGRLEARAMPLALPGLA